MNSTIFNAVISKNKKDWNKEDLYYTQQIIVDGIKETDIPSIRVTPSNIYKKYMAELDSFVYIQRVVTYDGYIVVYSSERICNNIQIDIIIY